VERRRQLLAICRAFLRKQWALEQPEKFNLIAVVPASNLTADFTEYTPLHFPTESCWEQPWTIFPKTMALFEQIG
jgi:hypothetical protein